MKFKNKATTKNFPLISISFLFLSLGVCGCKPKPQEDSAISETQQSASTSSGRRVAGLITYAKHNLLSLEFTVTAGITLAERQNLRKIVTLAREASVNQGSDSLGSTNFLKFYFTDTTPSSLSLYLQFMSLVDDYPQIMKMREPVHGWIIQPSADAYTPPAEMLAANQIQHISDTGLELMYFASTALSIYRSVQYAMTQFPMIPATHQQRLTRYSVMLVNRFVRPALALYKEKILPLNNRTKERGLTDYNMNHYADAWVADWMYEDIIQRIRAKKCLPSNNIGSLEYFETSINCLLAAKT